MAMRILAGKLLGEVSPIFLNDLFYNIKDVKLHAYADDEQLYDCDCDPVALDLHIQREVRIANTVML